MKRPFDSKRAIWYKVDVNKLLWLGLLLLFVLYLHLFSLVTNLQQRTYKHADTLYQVKTGHASRIESIENKLEDIENEFCLMYEGGNILKKCPL